MKVSFQETEGSLLTMKRLKVKVLTVLTHPNNKHMKLALGEYNKEVLIRELGEINYNFAIKEGWIEEIK